MDFRKLMKKYQKMIIAMAMGLGYFFFTCGLSLLFISLKENTNDFHYKFILLFLENAISVSFSCFLFYLIYLLDKAKKSYILHSLVFIASFFVILLISFFYLKI
jgi:hypothetical protein